MRDILLGLSLMFMCIIVSPYACAEKSAYALQMNALPTEIRQKMERAVRGSASDAYDLWYYFSIDMNDAKEAHFWIKLSAEQGLCEAKFQYAYELVYIFEDLPKAEYWLRKFEDIECDELLQRTERVASLKKFLAKKK